MNPVGEGGTSEVAVGLVEHCAAARRAAIALRGLSKSMLPRDEHLVGEEVDLLADAVDRRLQDAGLQRRPGVAGQQRRDVGLVELRRGLGRADFSTRASGSTSKPDWS